MKKEEISEAMKDIKFTESLMDTQSPEEIKKAFKAKGIDLSLEESEVLQWECLPMQLFQVQRIYFSAQAERY